MANLLDIYNDQYEGFEKEAEAEVNEEFEIIQKYASAAQSALAEEYGNDFSAEDVEKLASMMIEHDVEQEYMEEKVAEFVQAGQIMARAFKNELANE